MGAIAGHMVLVVEDDPAIRSLMIDFLQGEGFQVEAAEDGAVAVDILERHRPLADHWCAVLLDMMLPRLDGLGVMRRLRELGDHVPVIALSASREHLMQAMRSGAAAAVAKPFDVEHLLAVVTEHCPQAGA